MRRDEKSLKLEKIKYVFYGPLGGLLPPEVQENKTSYEAACIMSSTSRIVNGAWGIYSLCSLISKIFDMDIDPSPGNILTWAGLGVLADSIVREIIFGFQYVMDHPYSKYNIPWGEPLISILYGKNNK